MGGTTFTSIVIGKHTPQQAFRVAVEQARHEYGHRPYTGTISEKGDFIMVDAGRRDPYRVADELIDDENHPVYDKWGPAGCIEFQGKRKKELAERAGMKGKKGVRAFMFFGWASC